jgi:hypothetical protein
LATLYPLVKLITFLFENNCLLLNITKMKQIPTKKQNVAININVLLSVMVCVLMFYTSCRKADNSPIPSTSTQAATNEALSSEIAVNVAKSLAGNFGGINLMDGVDSVSLAGHNGPHHGYGLNSLCGFFTDSLVNYDHTQGDTTTHTGGNLTFYFNCENGKPTGYTAYDSLSTIKTTPKGSSEYYVKQYYTIKCLDNKHLFVGVNGDIYFYNSTTIMCGCHQTVTTIENANYVLKDLTVDLCHKDILSGTATFKAYGKNWYLTGTIIFLGGHMADITINNQVYHVNLLTGKII